MSLKGKRKIRKFKAAPSSDIDEDDAMLDHAIGEAEAGRQREMLQLLLTMTPGHSQCCNSRRSSAGGAQPKQSWAMSGLVGALVWQPLLFVGGACAPISGAHDIVIMTAKTAYIECEDYAALFATRGNPVNGAVERRENENKLFNAHAHIYTDRDRHTDRHRHRQTQTDRDRHRGTETRRHRDTQTRRHTVTLSHCHTVTPSHRHTERDRERDRDRDERERERDRQIDR